MTAMALALLRLHRHSVMGQLVVSRKNLMARAIKLQMSLLVSLRIWGVLMAQCFRAQLGCTANGSF
jgi:hypothetical protein